SRLPIGTRSRSEPPTTGRQRESHERRPRMTEPERSQRFQEGIQIRSEVLGAEHVRRSMENTSAFMKPIQNLVTEYCWGEVWSRPGLARRDRSLINIAMLSVLNRRHELGVHVRGAIANGVTPEEIQEVLLQVAIYAGVPAAL